MMSDEVFAAYLTGIGLAESTAAAYARFVAEYRALVPEAETATRAEVVAYLAGLRERGLAHATRVGRLAAVKTFYDYLAAAGLRDDHPCAKLTLRGPPRAERIDATELYTREWLADLLAEVRAEGDATRLALAGLLCHQALAPAEVCELPATAVDLDGGTVRAPGTGSIAPRELPLRAGQAIALARYLAEVRPGLIEAGVRGQWRRSKAWARGDEDGEAPTALLLSEYGRPLARQKLPAILNADRARERWLLPRRIRQSVVAHLLATGYDVSVVQAFAGHRYPSTTERYSGAALSDLADVVAKLHPRR